MQVAKIGFVLLQAVVEKPTSNLRWNTAGAYKTVRGKARKMTIVTILAPLQEVGWILPDNVGRQPTGAEKAGRTRLGLTSARSRSRWRGVGGRRRLALPGRAPGSSPLVAPGARVGSADPDARTGRALRSCTSAGGDQTSWE